MVSPQATQPAQPPHPRPTDWQREGDSTRLTAEDVPTAVRRQILRKHYEDRVSFQHAVVVEARINRDSLTERFRTNPNAVRPYQIDEANRQLTAARTVEQDLRATLAAYGNRDFRVVAR